MTASGQVSVQGWCKTAKHGQETVDLSCLVSAQVEQGSVIPSALHLVARWPDRLDKHCFELVADLRKCHRWKCKAK